jgi:plastocyanin
MTKASALLVSIALTILGLAACGGDDGGGGDSTTAVETTAPQTSGGGATATTTLELSAPEDGELSFNTDTLDAKAGSVTIDFNNPATLSHDVAIEDADGNEIGKSDLVAQGSASVTVDLQPGTYTFYCTVPGHREGGMEGTLTVK